MWAAAAWSANLKAHVSESVSEVFWHLKLYVRVQPIDVFGPVYRVSP